MSRGPAQTSLQLVLNCDLHEGLAGANLACGHVVPLAGTWGGAYLYDHRADVDQQIREDGELISRLKLEDGPGLLDRLRGATLGDSVSS